MLGVFGDTEGSWNKSSGKGFSRRRWPCGPAQAGRTRARVSEPELEARCLEPEPRGRWPHTRVATLSACNSPLCESVTGGWGHAFVILFPNIRRQSRIGIGIRTVNDIFPITKINVKTSFFFCCLRLNENKYVCGFLIYLLLCFGRKVFFLIEFTKQLCDVWGFLSVNT